MKGQILKGDLIATLKEKITNKLMTSPVSIIGAVIYGSWVRDMQTEDSDVECISNFRNHNPLFLDIAYEGVILIDSDSLLQNLMEETSKYIHQRGIEKLDDGWRFSVLYREPTFL